MINSKHPEMTPSICQRTNNKKIIFSNLKFSGVEHLRFHLI